MCFAPDPDISSIIYQPLNDDEFFRVYPRGQTKQKNKQKKVRRHPKKFSDQIYSSRLDSRGFLAKKKSIWGVSFLIVESQDRESRKQKMQDIEADAL